MGMTTHGATVHTLLTAAATQGISIDPMAWPNLATWVGIVLFGFLSVVRGWVIPKSSHEREIKLLTDVIAEKEKRIVEVIAEKNEWRAASIADQAVAQETRAQHRLLLETQRSTTYALEQMRSGFEQAASSRDVNHD